MKRNVKFLIGTLALFLTSFLVLIGCMHQIATDPGETQPYDSPTGTVEIPLDWELFEKILDSQEKKLREEWENALGTNAFENYLARFAGYHVEVDQSTIMEAKQAGKTAYYAPLLQKIALSYAVEAYHNNDLEAAERILERVSHRKEYCEWRGWDFPVAFSGQLKNGFSVSYTLAEFQDCVKNKKEQLAVDNLNKRFRSIVDSILTWKNAPASYGKYLDLTADEQAKLEPYTVDGKEIRYESVPALYQEKCLEHIGDAAFWKSLQSGNFIYFGAFEQDNNLENGKEPLLWKVFKEHDSGKLYLDCYPILRYMQWTEGDYEKDPTLLYWENCPIRTWLNGEFYETAFTQEEKKWIATALLENDWPEGMGGKATEDKVFFTSKKEKLYYFQVDNTSITNLRRVHKATDYAKATGAPTAVYGWEWDWTWQRDKDYGTYAGYWNGYRGVAPCVQIAIPAA